MNAATATRLKRSNLLMGVLHLLQGVAVLALSNGFGIPIVAAYADGPPGAAKPAPEVLFDLDIGLAVAVFLFLSAFFHFLIISRPFVDRYINGLDERRNNFRWVEYAMSSSVMIVLIATLTGITDLAALVALFGVNAAMIMFGALQEKYENPGGSLVPFWFGSIAGIVPWLAIALYLFSPGSSNEVPGFVYGIFFSLFVFFNTFAVNQWLQYKQVGKWSNYLRGERTYILLSLIAKSLLAWQIFAGTLAV